MSDAELLEPPALSVETRAMVALDSTATEQRLKALAVKNVAITQVIDGPGRADPGRGRKVQRGHGDRR